jgi:hypothetical protein
MDFKAKGASALLATVIVLGAASPTQAAVNLVQNPGFETGDLTGWSVGPLNNDWTVLPSNSHGMAPNPDGGNYFASTGCLIYCNLSQTLTTTPGATYSLSFEFDPGPGASPLGADTRVLWDGRQVLDIGVGPNAWTTYTVNGLVGTGSDQLTFSGYQICCTNGLDNVFVSTPGPVPGAGLAGLAFFIFAGAATTVRGLLAR